MDVKKEILAIASEIGFQRTVIASLEPLEKERLAFEKWLERGFAAGMEYLKRNPQLRTSPQLLYPQARSAIVVSASYYTERPADPGPRFGQVARYAVGLDYHAVLRAKLRELKDRLQIVMGKSIVAKPYSDDVALFEQAFASRSGLGFSGKNTLVIGPKLSGSYNFIAELFIDLDLPADEAYNGTCGNCTRCLSHCPTAAIFPDGQVDAGRCISYLTIENKDGIPLPLRPLLKNWLFGCDICQEVCPYNQKPPQTNWPEFQPAAGAGHYLDLYSIIDIKTDQEFRQRFERSAVRRPKRRGLIRNALVVLGNNRPADGIEKLETFLKAEEDPMLREHAQWALSQYAL